LEETAWATLLQLANDLTYNLLKLGCTKREMLLKPIFLEAVVLA